MPERIDDQAIESLLPHRNPFLFIKSAVWLSTSEISGAAFWVSDDPILTGHFPGKPVVPGVLQVEAAAQLAGLLITTNQKKLLSIKKVQPHEFIGVLASIQSASFHAMLLPGQVLNLHCAIRTLNDFSFLAKIQARTATDELVMTCELIIALKPVAQASKLCS